MDFIFRAAEKFLKDHKRLMRYRKIFAVMAAVVVFATTYELILPAITIDRQRAADTPGMEVGVAAEETVESDDADDSGDAEAEAKAEEEAKAKAEEEAKAKAEKEAQAEAEAKAAEEESQAAEEEVQEETQSESKEADADVNSSDAGAAESDASKKTEETADAENGNSAQNDADADSDTAAAGEKTVAEEADDGSGNTDTADASADTAAADAAAAVTTAAAEQAIEYPVTLTYEGDGYTITATFDETANLPAGVSLDALEILPDMVYRDEDGNVLYDDYEVYLEKTVETLEKDGRLEDSYVASARFFDISFIDPEGNYVEPAAPVVIAAQYKKALSAEDTVSTTAVRFDAEKDKTEIYETKQDVKNGAIAEISFETKKTSIYGIAAAEALQTKELTASGDTYEISLSYNQKAEIPEGAKLEAHELLPGTEEYEECAAKSANTDENGGTTSRFFDISIMTDGAEFEPKAPVNVKITLKDTAPEKVAADKEITHFTNDGQVENIPQEVEESSDGGAEVSFQMDSFSTVEVPMLGASNSYSVEVGKTITITGTTSGSNHYWSTKESDSNYIQVEGASPEATVKGLTVTSSDATVIHEYGNKEQGNKKNKTETFKVSVTEAVSGEITETAETSDGNVTVTVKRTGSTKKLEGNTLVVKKLTSGAGFDEYAQALTYNGGDVDALKGMYHIYLKDSNGKEVSVSNANMEVTITDPDLTGLTNVNVGHFKKNNSGAIESKGFTNEEATVFKKCSVSDNGITIKIQSFSVITVETISEISSSSSTGIITTHTAGGYSGSIVYTNTSSQIDYAYESYSANGGTVTKKIEPTVEENVFKVTIDVSQRASTEVIKEFFQSGGGYVLQSEGSFTGGKTVGSVGDYSPQAHDYRLYPTYQGSGSYAVTLNYTIGTETFSVTLYTSTNANGGQYHKIIVPLPTGKWLVVHEVDFKKNTYINSDFGATIAGNGPYNINLTSWSQSIYQAFSTSFISITNRIDSNRFEYLGSTIDGSNKMSGVSGVVLSASKPTSEGEMIVSGFGELDSGLSDSFSYYVRLKADGITPMDSTNTWPSPKTGGEYQEGSLNAVLNVNSVTVTDNSTGVTTVDSHTERVDFSITKPSVSGELYFIELEKVDSEFSSLKLPNAEFELRDSNGNVKATLKTNSNGKAVSTPGVPYGVYELYETKAPDGYTLTDSKNGDLKGTYALAYLGNSTRSDWVHEQLSSKKLGKLLTESNAISNTSIETELTLIKAGSDGTPLTADFTLVNTPKSGSNSDSETISISTGTILTIKGNGSRCGYNHQCYRSGKG